MNSSDLAGPPAVIVGFETNGLGVARSLFGRGVQCIGIADPVVHPAQATRSAKILRLREWSAGALIEELLLLAKQLDGKAPLLITQDEPVLWISRARAELQSAYEINLPPQAIVELLMNKARFLEKALREKWPVPQTWLAQSELELEEVRHEITYPCILKPQVKNSAFRQYSVRKAYMAQSFDELKEAYRTVAQWEKEVIVQEWIEGTDREVAFSLTYADRRGNLLAQFAGRKLRQWPPKFGNTAICEPAPPSWATAVNDWTQRIWSQVGFSGLGSVEFKIRHESQEPILTEPTVGRTNYQSEIAVLNGVNIPLLAYCDMTGKACPPHPKPASPVKLVDGPREIRSALACWRGNSLTIREWRLDRRGSKKYMLWRCSDPWPVLKSIAMGFVPAIANAIELLFGVSVRRRLASFIHPKRSMAETFSLTKDTKKK
jgi:predicted ATP-grasp superfamily ATP-dependent carboligase